MHAQKAIVIGGGIGGIASALQLRARGLDVTLLEKGHMLGGRARVFREAAFHFDAGPTVITAPSLLRELFSLFGERLDDHVTLLPVSPWYRMAFADGTHLNYGSHDAHGDGEGTMCNEIARFLGDPASPDISGYRALCKQADALYEVGYAALSHVPFHSPWQMVRALPDMARLRCDRTVFELVSRHLRDSRLQQAFSVHPLLVGGNPMTTTSIYSLIQSLERREGVWFPRGGTGALIAALGALAERNGVKVQLHAEVEKINIDRTAPKQTKRATGVSLKNGDVINANHIVCNVDPLWAYRHLLPADVSPRWRTNKLDQTDPSMGLFVLYFGTKVAYPDVAHHTILFGNAFKDELDAVFHRGAIIDDFSIYLHRPSATDPTMAPAGQDAFYALVAVPNLLGKLDWKIEGARLRERVIKKLGATLLPQLEQRLATDFFVTPEYFRDTLNSWAGAGFSIAPHFTQSAWFRPHNRAEGIAELYFAGAGTHPGAGVPGVIQSGRIVADLIAPPESRARVAA
jgi:phytoene desaturase